MLLDDELSGLTYLKMLCEQLPNLEIIKAFDNPIVFLNEAPQLDFDFCILDIEMPEMNGLQVANLIQGKPVIFATAYKEYATDAFDINAIDYIRKPIKIERLKQAVEKVSRHIQGNAVKDEKSFAQLNTDKGKAIIFFDKIAMIRSSDIDSRDKVLWLNGKERFVLKNITFERLAEILPKNEFCRVNRKEMISLQAIQFFSFDEITTNILNEEDENLKVTLSESYRKSFMEKVQI